MLMIQKLLNAKYLPHVITLSFILILFGLYRYFAFHDTYSNDSYVSANIINVSPLVAGPISEIYIIENQRV